MKDQQTLQKEIAKLKEENKSMKKIDVSKDQEIVSLNNKLKSKDNEIAALKKGKDMPADKPVIDKEMELEERYKTKSAAQEQKINSLEMRISQLNQENNRIQQANTLLTSQLQEKDEEINKLQSLQGEAKGQSPLITQNDQEKQTESQLANTTLQQETGQNASHQPDIPTSLQYEKALKEKEEEIAQSKEQITLLTNEIAVITREKENTLLSIEELKKNNEDTESKMHKLKSSVTEIKKKVEDDMIQKTTEINKTNEKLFTDLSTKNNNLEEALNSLRNSIQILNSEKTELEDIIIKQEDKITQYLNQTKEIETQLQRSRKENKETEKSSQELREIIKDIRKKNESLKITREEMKQTEHFQTDIDKLTIQLDLKDNQYAELLKKHKILQQNYKAICSDIRLVDTKKYLSQAKEMKKHKKEKSRGIKPSLLNTEEEEEEEEKKIFLPIETDVQIQRRNRNNNDQFIESNMNTEVILSQDLATPVILPPLKMKTPRLLNITNFSDENEEKKELNLMMSRIINEFV